MGWGEMFLYTGARAGGDLFTVKSKIKMLGHVKEGDFLYDEVQSIMGNGHMGASSPCGLND